MPNPPPGALGFSFRVTFLRSVYQVIYKGIGYLPYAVVNQLQCNYVTRLSLGPATAELLAEPMY